MHQSEKPFSLGRVTKLLFGLLLLVGLYLLFNKIKYALFPFIIGWLLAYFIHPFVNFLQYRLHLKNRVLSVVIALLIIIIMISVIIMLLIAPIENQVTVFKEYINAYQQKTGYIPMIPESWQKYVQENINFKDLLSLVNKEDWKNIVQETAPKIWNLFNGTISWIVSSLSYCIVLLYMFFILLDYDKISSQWMKMIPQKYSTIVSQIYNDIARDMNKYFRGQSLVALCVGILFSIGFTIINLPLGIILGMFIGLLNLVPYLQIIGLIPTVLLCLLKSATQNQNFWILLVLALLVFVIVQLIQDTIIVPKIMGKVTGLNPAIMLLSLAIFNALFGIIGMIIALPTTTFLISYYKRFVLQKNK